jgi:hypothetical protein
MTRTVIDYSSVPLLRDGIFFTFTPNPNELEIRFEALTASFRYIWAVPYQL